METSLLMVLITMVMMVMNHKKDDHKKIIITKTNFLFFFLFLRERLKTIEANYPLFADFLQTFCRRLKRLLLLINFCPYFFNERLDIGYILLNLS